MVSGVMYWPADRTDLLDTMRTAARTASIDMVETDGALNLAAYDFLVASDAHIDDAMAASIRSAPKLRWIQLTSSGSERTLAADLPHTVCITNAAVVWAPPVAEHAVALLLALMRQVPAVLRVQAERTWSPERVGPAMQSLDGATVLVVGTGAVGQQIAMRLEPFAANAIGVNRTGRCPSGAPFDAVRSIDALPSLLPQADAIFLSVPLRPATRHLIGEPELRSLKSSCYLVNVSRGQVVHSAALEEALRTGRLAGAGLDVADPEPLPADSALWTSDRVILSPHVASRSGRPIHAGARLGALVEDNATRFAEGQGLRHVVRAATAGTEEDG